MAEATIPAGFKPIKEGSATILFPENDEVFYNPVQEFNRDTSIAAIKTWRDIYIAEKREKEAKRVAKKQQHDPNYVPAPFDPKIKILEALSATGLRSIRYFKEIGDVEVILANDLDPNAVSAIRRNVEFNGLDTSKVIPNQGDATMVSYQHRDEEKRFDVIDLDPYGSAAIFLDGAVQAVNDGGLLCITCTDMAVLSGNHPETCFAKYASMPLRSQFCHEGALRILLATVSTIAARYKRVIAPLMCLSIDFYIRVFLRVHTSALEVKDLSSNFSNIYQCVGCTTFHLQPVGKKTVQGKSVKFAPGVGPVTGDTCKFCAAKFHIGGPYYNKQIQNADFIKAFLQRIKKDGPDAYKTRGRMEGMATVAAEELEFPMYYTVAALSGIVHTNALPILTFNSALLNAGYKVSGSHAKPDTIKTNAPPEFIWDVMRHWAIKHKVDHQKFPPNSAAFKILSVAPTHDVSFEIHPDANPPSRSIKLLRFQENPTPFWGPKARAGKKRKRGDTVLAGDDAPEPQNEEEDGNEEEGEEEEDADSEDRSKKRAVDDSSETERKEMDISSD